MKRNIGTVGYRIKSELEVPGLNNTDVLGVSAASPLIITHVWP